MAKAKVKTKAKVQGTRDETLQLERMVMTARSETGHVREALRFAEKQRDALKEQLDQPKDFPVQQFGMIPWPIAERVYAERSKKHPTSTTLREYGMRGGWAISEMDEFLPTWRDEIGELVRLRKRAAELEHYRISFPATMEAFMKATHELDEERARRMWAEKRISYGPMVSYDGKLALPNWFAESEAVREYWRAETKPKSSPKPPAKPPIPPQAHPTCRNCGRRTLVTVNPVPGVCWPCIDVFGDLCQKAQERGEKAVDIGATWARTKEIILGTTSKEG
jgi:hypothetical protein